MPRKLRRDKTRYDLSLEVTAAALDGDAWESFWGSEPEGRAAWESLRDDLPSPVGRRPEPFWRYEPDVPDQLRELPWTDYRRYREPGFVDDAEWVQRARTAWLLSEGSRHLRPGEREALQPHQSE